MLLQIIKPQAFLGEELLTINKVNVFKNLAKNSKAKVTRLQKGLVTRYTHVKYSSAIAHC